MTHIEKCRFKMTAVMVGILEPLQRQVERSLPMPLREYRSCFFKVCRAHVKFDTWNINTIPVVA